MRMDSDFAMTINGKPRGEKLALSVVNPATGVVFATAPDCSSEELDAAVTSAQAAFGAWRRLSFDQRKVYLLRARDAILEHADPLALLLTQEHGRPLDGALFEIQGAAQWLEAVAAMSEPRQVHEDTQHQRVETVYEPLGVVCAIAPWNFPVSLAVWKVAPALLAGNTVVLKPSPFCPLCVLKIGEILAAVLPPGVLNVVSGGDQLGPMMTSHPGFAKIAFTGSTATGRRVMEAAAKGLKPVTLELGGNDPAIVMNDVDVDAIAEKIFFSAFVNSAQICVATKRLYVHDTVYDALRDRLAAMAAQAVVGDGATPGVFLGPIQNKRQYDRVMDLLHDARDRGHKLIQGAAAPSHGYFVPITIVDDPPEDSRVVQEEAFGPILPMMRFHTVSEAISKANRSAFGLGASVWCSNPELAADIATQLEAGTVWINQVINLRPDTPFAGHKQSGVGVENGADGLLQYLKPKSVFSSPAPKVET